MVDDLRQAKQPVSAMLAGPYGHPWHPILVTVPIGAWVASLVFDVASRVVADPGFLARGSEWLIGIGVIGAVLAALALSGYLGGMLAYRYGVRVAAETDQAEGYQSVRAE